MTAASLRLVGLGAKLVHLIQVVGVSFSPGDSNCLNNYHVVIYISPTRLKVVGSYTKWLE